MSVNIDALFQHLMEDPDLIPPEGEEKEDIAMAMATQRAKQSNNNVKALNMAGEDRTISKLLAFLKAEGDDDSPLTPGQMYAYSNHLETINKLTKKLQGGGKLTVKQQRDWDAAETFSEDIAAPADLPGIHDVIDDYNESVEEAEGEGVAEADEEGEEAQAPVRTRTPKESMGTRPPGLTEAEAKTRAGMSSEEKAADVQARIAEASKELSPQEIKVLKTAQENRNKHEAKRQELTEERDAVQAEHDALDAQREAGRRVANPDDVAKGQQPIYERVPGVEVPRDINNQLNAKRSEIAGHQQTIDQVERRIKTADDKLAEFGIVQPEPVDKPHHSLTSAVDALSDAEPDVELDHYGNAPDSPFHVSRFGDGASGVRAYHDIHEEFEGADLAEAFDQLEKEGKEHTLNLGARKEGYLQGDAVRDMMDRFFEAQGRQEGASSAPEGRFTVAGQRPTNAAQKWFDAHLPDRKTGEEVNQVGSKGVAEWDQLVKDNDLTNKPEEVIHDHLYSFLQGKGKNPPAPPKAQATAEHVEPDAAKKIVAASQSDNPEDAIDVVLSEHNRAVIDNPVLNPHQQQIMIDAANEMAKIAAKKVSTEDNPIVITPIDPVEITGDILEHAADIHIEAESNGATDDEKVKAAEDVHSASLIHETNGGDAEEVLNNSGVEYKKLKNGQYYFHSGSATKSRGDWGNVQHLAARDAETDGGGDEHWLDQKEPEPATLESTEQFWEQRKKDEEAKKAAAEAPKSAVEELSQRQQEEVSAGTQRVRAEQIREHDGLVAKLRNRNTTDKDAVVGEIRALGDRINPDGGGDAAVKHALDQFEAIGERDPNDPSGPANNPEMHRALGGTPPIDITPVPDVDDSDVDWDNLDEAQRNSVTDNGGIETDDGFIDAPQHIQEQHGFKAEVPKIEVTPPAAKPKMTAAARKHLIDNGYNPDDPESTFAEQLDQIRTKKEAQALIDAQQSEEGASPEVETPEVETPEDPPVRRARGVAKKLQEAGFNPKDFPDIKSHEQADGHIANNPQMEISPADAEGGGPTEEETSEETSTAEPEPESEEEDGDPEQPIEITAPDPEPEEGDGEPVDEPAPRAGQQSLGLPKPTAAERRGAQPARSPEQARLDDAGVEEDTPEDQVGPRAGATLEEAAQARAAQQAVDATTQAEAPRTRTTRARVGQQRMPLGGPVPTRGEASTVRTGDVGPDSIIDDGGEVVPAEEVQEGPRAGARLEESDVAVANKMKQDKKDFLLANKMTPDRLNALSDEDIDKEFNKAHQKISDKAMSDHLAGKPAKEEILQAMAKAHGRDGDTAYLQQLREEHQFASPEELVKEHKAVEKEKAANKFEHERSQANADALGMEKLPEEGTDKLHAMDRARDIGKKMDNSTRSVQKGGKPLLDQNSKQHLLDLLHDAIDTGQLTQEEVDSIADEGLSMGEKFMDEEHRESIADDNARKRAHHEEFLDHAEGTSEEALQRRGHDLDHSKAHELHHYEEDEEGNKTRTGSSHSTRDEDGSVKHMDASGEGGVPGSDDDAVEGMEAQHPPKLLGLDEDGKAEQIDHFNLMKKAAKGELEPGDFEKFKELEANNPDLADPKYKGQVLGAVRHQLSGEDGGDKMSGMGIDGKDHDEAAESSCRPPAGAMPTGVGKAWNPDTHRWCDKEYLDELKGQLGPGEASYHPDGVHAGTDNAHLDQDADGNVQAAMVTPTGVHKVNPSSGEMKTADGGAVSQADVLGHHLKDHAGGKVGKDTLNAMGMNHSEKHAGEGQKGGGLGQAFQETPGMQMAKPILGKLGRMMQRNKKSEEGKPNATGTDRQRARRDTEGSPSSSFLNKLGKYTKEGLKDAAEELPEYAGGGLLRGGQKIPFTDKTVGGTDRWQDKQVRQAADRVAKRQSAADKLTERINRVTGENE